ncbi:MAG: anion transporter family protein [Anaerosporomusa subterranea]|jgi:DASS family divalent anion:Na+ symporter|nr:anion transporter family protein [Anaerosporomusa subterranea]
MNTRLWKGLVVIGIGAVLWVSPVPAGLKPQAWQLFAIFAATIAGLILQPLPMGVTCFVSITFTALVGVLKPDQVLSGFGNLTIWLIVSAFLFSRGFIKTGLGRRIAFLIMRAIGHRTINLAYALAISDLIISPATPSVTARSGGIIFPIAKSLAVAFDSEPGASSRRIGAFLIQSVTHVSMVTSTLFLTSQAGNTLVAALAAKTLNYQIDWLLWFKASVVPGLISFMLMPYLLYKFYPPEIKETPEAKQIAQKELDQMGPIKTTEKILIFVFVSSLTLWATGQWTNINPTTVGMIGVSIMLVGNVLDWQDMIGEKSAWDTMMWMGSIITLAGFLNSLGFIAWFSKLISGAIVGFSWTVALALILVVYMYTQYAFAGLSAHVTALFPALAAVAIATGAPVAMTVLSLGFVSSLCGCLTHYASGPSPIFFGAGYTDIKTWWKIGFWISLVHLLVWGVVGSLWWKAIGLW